MNLKFKFLYFFVGVLFVFSCNPLPITDLSTASLIPFPKEIKATESAFLLTEVQEYSVGNPDILPIGNELSKTWSELTSFPIKLGTEAPIHFALSEQGRFSNPEEYHLEITKTSISLIGASPEGVYRGWKTLEQLLWFSKINDQNYLPTGTILDAPDYAYRGAMLDVARHFFSVAEVKRYIDQLSHYKINHLHLHLSDDQGWRIEIKSWPKLTEIGGSTEVGGESGGFYTQKDYQELVAYAAERFITIVPEIDMPGHTNAALASYPQLNCNGQATDLYEGIEVGFSTLCVEKAITYEFVEDVIREISAITPGPYFHIGGDESHATPEKKYITFFNKVLPMVDKYNKTPFGWDEVQLAEIQENTVVQYWNVAENALNAKQKGAKVLISPASYAYLDMQYDSITPLGLHWAGYVNLKKGYNWVPEELVDGILKEDIIGIEAPLWSETITNSDDLEFMAFPRLPGYAEIGWTQKEKRNWENYRKRLADHGTIFDAWGVNFYRSSMIDWK